VYYGDHMNGSDWAAMIAWMVFLLIVLAIVIWAIGYWLGAWGHNQRSPSGKSSARELLDDRLARGEIDVEEYQRRRSALE
jgi:putative membrane protein